MTRPIPRRIAAAAAAAMLVVSAAPAASAATTDVSDGTLDWGVKESFRTYVVGQAGGEIEVDGVSENSDGSFGFSGGAGTVGESAADVSFTGSVRFTGHEGTLDATVSDPGVEMDGSTGSLVVDIAALGQDGEVVEMADVAVADLDLSGVSLAPDADGVVSASGVPATLTEAGATAFAGFYSAGEALDPVSFTVQTSGEEVAADEALPKTGAPWQWIAVGGIVLLGLGATSVLFSRRHVASARR